MANSSEDFGGKGEKKKGCVINYFENMTHIKRKNDTKNTFIFLRVRIIKCNFATDFKLKIKTISVEVISSLCDRSFLLFNNKCL